MMIFTWLLSALIMIIIYSLFLISYPLRMMCSANFNFPSAYMKSFLFFESGYEIPIGSSYLEFIVFVLVILYYPFLSYMLDFSILLLISLSFL
jgi:hypothetical protein